MANSVPETLREALYRQSCVVVVLRDLLAKPGELSMEDLRAAVDQMMHEKIVSPSAAELYLISFPSNPESPWLRRCVELHHTAADHELLKIAEAIAAYGSMVRAAQGERVQAVPIVPNDSLMTLLRTTLHQMPAASEMNH